MYIAIGINENGPIPAEDELRPLAEKYDLKLIYQSRFTDDIDSEVIEGARAFASAFQLKLYQVIRLSTEKKFKMSSKVEEDLVEFFLQKKERPDLVDFLVAARDLLPDEYHLIFADEWFADEKVRYVTYHVDELEKYFTRNNSWYLYFYDYHAKMFHCDVDTPLIMEIISK